MMVEVLINELSDAGSIPAVSIQLLEICWMDKKIVGTDNGDTPTPPMTVPTYKDGVVDSDVGTPSP